MTSDDLAARGAPELLPCPFCGGEAGPLTDATRILGTWNIVHRCSVIGPFKIEKPTREAVIALWNRRATPTALAASPEVAKLIREAEVRGMERAADMVAVLQEACVDECVRIWAEERSEEIRAEAAAIRGEGK